MLGLACRIRGWNCGIASNRKGDTMTSAEMLVYADTKHNLVTMIINKIESAFDQNTKTYEIVYLTLMNLTIDQLQSLLTFIAVKK
jgi:hypothetical protein